MESEQSLGQHKVFHGWTKAGWVILAKAAGWYALSFVGAFVASMLVMFFFLKPSRPAQMDVAMVFGIFVMVPTAMLQIWFSVRNARKMAGGDHNAGLRNVAHDKQGAAWLIASLMAIKAVVWVSLQGDPSDQVPQFRDVDPVIYVASTVCMGVAMSAATALFLYGWLWTALEPHWGVFKAGATITLFSFMLNSALSPNAMLQAALFVAGLAYVRYVSQSVRPVVLVSVVHSIAGSLATILFFVD
ncbi:hypothetical protein [Ferrovibrio terrae]|uniref:hypothetical protein n=1 Tax=Ferrovibrio terrae TaxID=2594003 RepID=UPI003137CFDF